MRRTIVVFLSVLAVVIAKVKSGEKETTECLEKTNLDPQILDNFVNAKANVPVDNLGAQAFFQCRFGKYFDDHNKLILNAESLKEVEEYFVNIMKGKRLLANVLAKAILPKCVGVIADTKPKIVIMTVNCGMNEFKKYHVQC